MYKLLHLTHITETDVFRDIKHLKPKKDRLARMFAHNFGMGLLKRMQFYLSKRIWLCHYNV